MTQALVGGFVYPYAFVRPGRPAPRASPTGLGRFTGLSGRITCEARLLTPLCIPDSERVSWVADREHPWLPFFRRGAAPCVPGSSIKGAVRSLFETITQSAWSVVDLGPLSHRLNPRLRGDQGEMRRFKPARVLALPAGPDDPGRVVLFRRASRVPLAHAAGHPEGGRLVWGGFVGFLHRTGAEPGKRHEALFGPADDPADEFALPWHAVRLYDAMHEALGTRDGGSLRRLRPGSLVYVRVGPDGRAVTAVADTRVPRISYPRSVGDLLREHDEADGRSFLPPDDLSRLDPASRLFGAVRSGSDAERGNGWAGALRFSAGRIDGAASFEWRTLRVLGQPHPASVAFYLQRVRSGTGQSGDAPELMSRVTLAQNKPGFRSLGYDHPEARLRGRKFYWSHPSAAEGPEEFALEADARWAATALPLHGGQNASVELLAPGSSLIFDVDYQGLSGWELGALLWSLSPGWVDRRLTLRLGRGKPLGLGAVSVTIQAHDVHDRVSRYRSLSGSGGRPATEEEHARWTLDYFEWLLETQGTDGEMSERAPVPAGGAVARGGATATPGGEARPPGAPDAPLGHSEVTRRLAEARARLEGLPWWQDLLRLLDAGGPPAGPGGAASVRYPRFYAIDHPRVGRDGEIARRLFAWFRPYQEGHPDPSRAYVPLTCEVEKRLMPSEGDDG